MFLILKYSPMKNFNNFTKCIKPVIAFLLMLVTLTINVDAQTLPISDFVLFSSNGGAGTTIPPSPGYGVQLGSATTITGGSIGSKKLMKTTGTSTITGNIFSLGTVVLANSNSVSGKITAANSPSISGTILSVGNSANIGGNIDVNGNVVVGGGTVSGKVTHPSGTTYTGPTPGGGNVNGVPTLPSLPALPVATVFPPYPNIADITSTSTINAGAYDDVKLSGNQTLTFNGPGIYVFDKIENSSGVNTFVFNFQNNPTGTFKIYVHNNVSLGKLAVSLLNGGSASRIYLETHGTGLGSTKNSFIIANGSSGSPSKWMGTVWATKAAISIGSGAQWFYWWLCSGINFCRYIFSATQQN